MRRRLRRSCGTPQIEKDAPAEERKSAGQRIPHPNQAKRQLPTHDTVSYESERTYCYLASAEDEDLRLDVFLSSRPLALSRSRVQALVKSGRVEVNQAASRASYRLREGDRIAISIPPAASPVVEPEAVDFRVVHEDESLIVLDKPPGIVVHPAPGHSSGTLVHGLLHHCTDLSGIGGVLRPGIVHRLDKDTSGLMVVAKNDDAHHYLAGEFKAGRVKKEYLALAHGRVKDDRGEVDLPIGRHPKKRKEMSVSLEKGRRALTLWKKLEEFQSGFSLLSVVIKTGRTHQIRVHLSYLGHPVVGDSVYGFGVNWWKTQGLAKKGLLRGAERQMLHARRLSFVHPDGGRAVDFEAPIPRDMAELLAALRRFDSGGKADKALDNKNNVAIYNYV